MSVAGVEQLHKRSGNMSTDKVKERIVLGGNLGESPTVPLEMLCDEVKQNRKVLTKLIAYLGQELGKSNAENLIKELESELDQE